MKSVMSQVNYYKHVSHRTMLLENLIKNDIKYQIMTNRKHLLNLIDDLSKELKSDNVPYADNLHDELQTLAETIHRYTGITSDIKELRTLVNNTFSDINDEVSLKVNVNN